MDLTSAVDKHKKQIKRAPHDLCLVPSSLLSLKYVNIFSYTMQLWWAFFFFKQTRNWQRKHLRHIFGYNNFLYSFGNSQLPLWLKDSGLMWIRTHTLSTCLTFNELNTQQTLS